MTTAAAGISEFTDSDPLKLPEGNHCESRWYAAYTTANHEKRVAEQLSMRRVEHFLPLYTSMRRWKDRRIRLDMPLFPGYVFVRMTLRDRLQVLQIKGVAYLVNFGGTPAALPADEIETLRASLLRNAEVRPHPYLAVGQRVTLRSGPLSGLTGILVRRKSGARLVVSLDLILRSVAVELDEADLVVAQRGISTYRSNKMEGGRSWLVRTIE